MSDDDPWDVQNPDPRINISIMEKPDDPSIHSQLNIKGQDPKYKDVEAREKVKDIWDIFKTKWFRTLLMISFVWFILAIISIVLCAVVFTIWLVGAIVAFIVQIINRGKFPYLSMYDILNNSFWSWIYIYLFYTKI